MRETITDAFRLVCKCYEIIERSALHIYHSALVITPTEQLLYKRYCKEMTHKACWLRGGLAQWDPLIATVTHPSDDPRHMSVMFSPDSSQLASLAQKEIRFWDALSGTPISSSKLGGDNIVLADDFSIAATLCDNTIELYSVATNMATATFRHSSRVNKLALSHDGSRLAAALSTNATILWDVQKQKPILTLNGSSYKVLMFSPRYCVLATLLGDEIQLWNGTTGESIARLDYESEVHVESVFSSDGSRLSSLTQNDRTHSLTLWNGENGNFIAAAKDVEEVGNVRELAISDDGSFLAAALWDSVELWSAVDRNPLSLVDSIEMEGRNSLAFSRDLFAMASYVGDTVKLYDLRSRTIILTLQGSPTSLAISPDGTRLAGGNEHYGTIHLWDIASIEVSDPDSKKQSNSVFALAFSPDRSRLAAGFKDGTIELWNTDQAEQPIATHKLHEELVGVLAFSPDGEQLASGSHDRTIRVWDGRNGSTNSVIEPTFPDWPTSVAFSSGLLAAATTEGITLWDPKTLLPIDAISLSSLASPFPDIEDVLLSSPAGSSLLAIACSRTSTSNVTVWDMGGRTKLATFQVDSFIRNLTLSPDGSQVFAEMNDGSFRLFNVSCGNVIQQTGRDDLSWIPNFTGIPISWNLDDNFMGRFSERYERIPLFHFPAGVEIASVAVGSSMFAVGCRDGRLLLVRS